MEATLESPSLNDVLAEIGDADFDALMSEVDRQVRPKAPAIRQRAMAALVHISIHFDIEISSKERLWERIFSWETERYGHKLYAPRWKGCSVILVDGDVYRIDEVHDDPLDKPLKLWEGVQGLTESRVKSLDVTALADLRQQDTEAYECWRHMQWIQADEFRNVLKTLDSACSNITSSRPALGVARWDTHMALEFALKDLLRAKGVPFRKSHDLGELAQSVETSGLGQLSSADIAAVQCDPGTRYRSDGLTIEDSVRAYQACLRAIAQVSRGFGVVVSERIRAKRLEMKKAEQNPAERKD